MQWLKLVFYHLSAENDVKCDGMCVFHIHLCTMFTLHEVFYTVRKKIYVPLSYGIKQYLFGVATLL